MSSLRIFFIALMFTIGSAGGQPVPDFSLRDVNTASPRANAMVSPRDYVLQVSGYYFGAAH